MRSANGLTVWCRAHMLEALGSSTSQRVFFWFLCSDGCSLQHHSSSIYDCWVKGPGFDPQSRPSRESFLSHLNSFYLPSTQGPEYDYCIWRSGTKPKKAMTASCAHESCLVWCKIKTLSQKTLTPTVWWGFEPTTLDIGSFALTNWATELLVI